MKTSSAFFLFACLKVIALLLYVFYTNQGLLFRLNYLLENNNYSTLVVFSVLWIFSLCVMLTVCFQQNVLLRLFWGIVIALSTAVSFGFYAAGGSELELLDVFELWQARHETGRAMSHFSNAAIQAVIVAVVGILIFVYPPPKLSIGKSNLLKWFSWLPLIPLLAFSSLVFIKSDKAVAGLPQQFSPTSMALAIGYKSAVYSIPQRNTVDQAPTEKAKVQHLLYLVDESINPNYVFSAKGKYLKGFEDNRDKIADFGIAVSGSNCSARSNAILRLGAIRDNLIQSVRTSPSIWQFAKKAGFRTVYIDSQASEKVVTKPNDFQNYMTQAEASFIDAFYKVKNVPGPQLDYELLDLVKKELLSDTPTFIYANKNGAHFPYSDNYPENETIHLPVVEKNKAQGIGGLLDLYKKGKGIQPVINTYKNSVHWTVDKFFRKFFDEIDLNNTAVIYTSDHGQYFELDSTTHCTSGEGAFAAEGLVPLMMMSGKESLLSNYKQAAKTNFNKLDHFALFPTVLNLLGYSESQQKQYGSTLLEETSNEVSAFNTGDILGIVSMDTIWREVSLEEKLENTPNNPQ